MPELPVSPFVRGVNRERVSVLNSPLGTLIYIPLGARHTSSGAYQNTRDSKEGLSVFSGLTGRADCRPGKKGLESGGIWVMQSMVFFGDKFREIVLCDYFINSCSCK